MAVPRPGNPYSAFNFTVEVDGVTVGAFQEIDGLDGGNTPIDYREGGDPTNAIRKLPGLEEYNKVTMKRGITGEITDPHSLWQLRKEVRDAGNSFPPKHQVVIHLQNEAHQSVYQWTLTNAWLSKLVGPTLNATGNAIAIESAEWVHERLDIS
ncbi:MAG TPA: phage tail protein [Polyangia bacterium]|jgi:phage tail-like protein|nr:phage tail protein [Polyangia bacterium]